MKLYPKRASKARVKRFSHIVRTSCDRNAHDCPDRGNVLPLPNYRRIFFYFFFLPSFTVKSGSVTGCSIKIYRPGEKTREREREGKEKKMLSTALTLLFPFTLVSSSRGTADEQVYRTTRRIMNRNAGIVFRSGSRLTRF